MSSINQPDYIKRINRLREGVNRGWLLLYRGGECFNENLYYLTGLDSFFTAALISLETDESYVLVHPIEYDAVTARCSIGDVISCASHQIPKRLSALISRHTVDLLYTDYSFDSRTPLPAELIDSIRADCPHTQVRPLPEPLLKMRAVKEDCELKKIRKGLGIIEKIFSSIPDMIHPGVKENEIAAEIYRQLIAGGFNKFFDIFVASGKHTASPFYRANNDILPPNSVILIDICAAIDNYTCDVTRTLPTSGRFAKRHEELYSAVADIHNETILRVAVGNTLANISQHAKEGFASHGLDQYYLNKIGHFVGLSPDDPGAQDTPFQKGMVLTIEPGLYMPHEGIGIRIEDTMIVE
jgi:Xaa-Pro aminopeptidase